MEYLQKLTKILDKKLSLGLTIAILLAASWLFFYPTISANVLFQDDTTRTVAHNSHSNHNYSINGRFMIEMVSRFMSNFSAFPVDYGNLGQILGALSVAAAVLILLYKKLDFSIRSILAALPLIINPFILHNLSYRYDSMGMLLGYSLAIIAFALFANTKRGFIFSSLLLFISFGFYQSMPAIFLALIALSFVWSILDSRQNYIKSIQTLVVQASSYAVGLILYTIATKTIFPILNPRNSPSIALSSVVDNSERLFELLQLYYQGGMGLVAVVSLILSVLAFMYYVYRSKRQRLSRGALIVIGVFLSFAALLGPMLFLDNALIYPRSMPAIVIFMLIPGIAMLASRKTPLLQGVFASLLALALLQTTVFSHSYGAFLKSQDSYRSLVVSSIYQSIQNNNLAGKFYVNGTASSPVNSHKTYSKYPILRHYWGSSTLNNPSWTKRILKNLNVNVVVDWEKEYPGQKDAICQQEQSSLVVQANNYLVYDIPIDKDYKEYLIFLRSNERTPYCK